MPEDLLLPGIDPAPAAPAAPAAPSAPQEDTATQSASVDTGAPAPPADAPVEQPEEVARKRESRGVQKRIDELVARERAADARAERALALVEAQVRERQQPVNRQADPNHDPQPDRSKYDDWETFRDDQSRWVARQEVRQQLERQNREAWEHNERAQAEHRQQTVRQATEQLEGVVGAQLQEASSRYPDYHEVIESCGVNIPVNLQAAMALTGNAGDVGYYLARNPRLIQQLSNLPDMALQHQVGRIATAMRTNAASVSNAPAPGRPTGNRGTAVSDYPKDATPEQHLAWEKAQKRQEKRA